MDAAEQLDAERVSKEKLNGWWFFKDLLGLFITIWGRWNHFDYSPGKKKKEKHVAEKGMWLEDYFPFEMAPV